MNADFGPRPEPQLRILQATCQRLNSWRHDDLAAPWWRAYWNAESGAAVTHKGRRVPLGPDRVVLISPNTPYAAHLDRPCSHFFVHFLLARDFRVRAQVYSFDIQAETCREVAETCRCGPGGPAAILLLHRYILGVLARIPSEDWQEPVRDHRLRRALRAMERSPESPPANAELARAASLSTNGFVRLFRETMGLPPQTYQMNRRIDRSCAALVNTDKSVETIARETGFCDRAHLTRMFKKYMQNTPGAYRREHRLT